LAYAFIGVVSLPILVGGKVYHMMQMVFTAKIIVVLSFCLVIGIVCVTPGNWWSVFRGFVTLGNVPVSDPQGGEIVVNAFSHWWTHGQWPVIALGNIALLGAFAGYAGGGGLSNSTYSNFVRDKGWGMGSLVGAIPSAIGGHNISLSHLGTAFPIHAENLRRWRGWWKYILSDQLLVWAPGCFMGMALPSLLSIQFAQYSDLYHQTTRLDWAQAIITADGIRHAPRFSPATGDLLWMICLCVGLMVLLPSQMSIVEDICRRWTDILWSGNRHIRQTFATSQVRWIYYTILGLYVAWSFFCAWLFLTYGQPKLMVLVIANLNNIALGVTAFVLLWVNLTLLPRPLRPGWINRCGVFCCGVFYLGLALLVIYHKK
jgi:hypothetical protein